jgi:hypothetical protein
MIQPVPKSNNEEKSITRQVNLAVTLPLATMELLDIMFSNPIQEDSPTIYKNFVFKKFPSKFVPFFEYPK